MSICFTFPDSPIACVLREKPTKDQKETNPSTDISLSEACDRIKKSLDSIEESLERMVKLQREMRDWIVELYSSPR